VGRQQRDEVRKEVDAVTDRAKAIILVRHAEPEQGQPGQTQGHWTDTALSELGRCQAACAATRLKAELAGVACRLVSSDLKRASQTADAIGRALGIEVETTPELREFNDGLAVGGTEEALQQRATPAGESWQAFYDRTSGCLQRLADERDRVLVVVSHYGTMINLVSWWVGTGLDAGGDVPVSFDATLAAITVLRINRQGKRALERLNDTAHLREAGLGLPFKLDP
jgi:2,3-bisphosphoglycerate-dependent phosphoglycerate mutase